MQSSKSAQSALVRYAKISIIGSWLISVVVTVFVLVLADFGAPSWIFILCGLWLSSFGLPTTLTLLALAGFWGQIPGIETPPLSVFAISFVILSLIAQTISFLAVGRFVSRWRNL